MKKSNHFAKKPIIRFMFLFGFSILFIACSNKTKKDEIEVKEEATVTKAPEILWKIKAVHPDSIALTIKAIDEDGNMYDVNAIQNSDQDSFLDIEAFVKGKKLPVKILMNDDKYAPIKAIDIGGISYDIKAITPEGEKLDVKGIKRYGNIVSIKAITKDGEFYSVRAISPTGKQNDVEGIKINHKDKEMTLNGFNVFAHIKAMHQSDSDYEALTKKHLAKTSKKKATKKPKSKNKRKVKSDFKNIIWDIKVITQDGKRLKVKAIDEEGNMFDINAIQDSYQYSFLNMKATVNGSELPIKVLVSEDEYSPIKAISREGTIYDIKAIAADGSFIAIKGIKRLGNIIDIKAVTSSGDFYEIKAISPKGKLNDVKGIKIFDRATEMTLRGNKVYAHIKAITQ